jgi:hypothetical protein
MLATTTPFQTMVEGRSQVVAFQVEIDLPGGIYPDVSLAVTALEIDASIDTDMPEGTRLEEGFSSVQGTFTLAGRVDAADATKTAAWLFGRYSTTSPLYRTDVLYRQVTIKLGLYPAGSGGTPELLTKLVGLVEDYGLDAAGNVAFTVFDLRQSFRGGVDLPAVVTVPPFNAGLTNEFMVDRLLRQSTGGAISSWPAIRPQCVLAVGFRSSLWPEVGTLHSLSMQPVPTFIPGPWGTGLGIVTPSVGGATDASYDLAAPLGDDLYAELLVSGIDIANVNLELTTVGGEDLKVQISPTLISLIWHHPSTTPTSATWSTTVAAGPHIVSVQFHMPVGSSAFSATIYLDGVSHSTGSVPTSTARTDTFTQADPIIGAGAAIAGLQVTAEAAGVQIYPFTPRAVLDASLNPLNVVPAVTDQTDAWAAIQSLAASELAVAGFEGDTFYYKNRQTLRASASVRTITSDTALNDIGESSSSASIVNRAQVGWTPWTFAATAATLWSATAVHKVPAHGTWTTTVTLDNLATQIDTAASVLPASSTDTTASYFRASIDKFGTAKHGGITVAVTPTGGNTFTVTATNSTGTPAWLVSSAEYVSDSPLIAPGTPLLRVAGIAVTSGDEQTTDYQWPLPGVVGANGLSGAAGSRFGEILYQLTGNQWIQDEATAQQLAQDIVCGSYIPKADLLNVDIDPDARIQRTDRVQIVDTARTGINAYALVFGFTITYQAPSQPGGQPTFTMTMDARTVNAPGSWLLGVTGSSELGQTTYLPGSVT